MIGMMNLLMVHQCNTEGLMAHLWTLVCGSVQGWCVGLPTTGKDWMFSISDTLSPFHTLHWVSPDDTTSLSNHSQALHKRSQGQL